MREDILTLSETLKILNGKKSQFENEYGITAIGVFGSVARGESNSDSDIDIVVKMKKPDLYSMVHIKEDLENQYHRKVDIVHYREKMNPFLKKRIDRDVLYV